MSVEIKADIRHWLRELDKKYFFVMLGFAVMVYFPLISLKLTNTVDGLWTTAEYMAGAWELSNGRWFWLVTSFLRFSLQLEPINAVVCLVLVSLGVTRLHMLFKPAWMRTSCIDWLAGLCYVSNVVVGCYLSFHFIAPEYGFSFFFAMLATEHVIRGKSAVSSIVPAAVLLALSLGLYQTNLACFCLVLLAYFLLLLFQNGEKQKIREYICKSLASAASGAVLYLLILKITLWATGTAMADYQGGADISVSGILKNLPSSVEKCYELFYRYFFGTLVKHNMLQETAVVFALIFCVVGAALACRLVRLIRRKDWENTFYGTAALLGAVQAVITDNAWGKLTENQQAAIMEAGADTQAFNADLSETAENKVLDELKSSGCNVVDVPDKAPWQEACQKVISENTSDQAELYQQLLDMKA